MIWLLMQRLGVTTLDHVNLDQVPSDYQVVVRSKGPEFPCINEIEVRGTGVANNVEQPKPSEPPKEEGPIKYY